MASISKRTSGAWQNTSYGIRATATDTITTLPTTIYGDGTPLLDYLISGNTTQSGTPTPDNPIMPQGTGERTGNLWDEEYPNISGTTRYIPLYVGEGSFTLSTTTPYDSSVANLFLLSGNVPSGASTSGNGAWLKHNVTVQSDGGYITIAYRHYAGTTSPADCKTMLNTGSTALPYEPYGFEISISSANITTSVYLGEVQTTRRITKIKLNSLQWENYTGGNTLFFRSTTEIPRISGSGDGTMYCTIYKSYTSRVNLETLNYGIAPVNAVANNRLCVRDTRYTTVSDWLAANGDAELWFINATETTGIVNEPLMRIGDYADTVSKEQAGVTIPTSNGSTTVDVETTVKPSEVSINYHGWHMGTVHERVSGQWD